MASMVSKSSVSSDQSDAHSKTKVLDLLKQLENACQIDWKNWRSDVDGHSKIFDLLTTLKECGQGSPAKHLTSSIDRYAGQYSSYINPRRMRELLVLQLNNHRINPSIIIKSDLNDSIVNRFNGHNLGLALTDDVNVSMQILACNSRGGYKMNPSTGEMEKVIFSYGFYVRFLKKPSTNHGKCKYVRIGETNAQPVSIDSDRCYWGYVGSLTPAWVENADLDSELKSYPKSVVDTNTMLITLNYNAKSGIAENKRWSSSPRNTMYPAYNKKINRLRQDKFHWLGHEVGGDLYCVYERLKGNREKTCPVLSTTVKYNTLQRLKNVYLPDEEGNVFAIAKEN